MQAEIPNRSYRKKTLKTENNILWEQLSLSKLVILLLLSVISDGRFTYVWVFHFQCEKCFLYLMNLRMFCLKYYTELYVFSVVWTEENRDEPCKQYKHFDFKVLSFKLCIKVGLIAWWDLFCGSFTALYRI